ncbi:hypothetical protein [Pedobacter immunditicola]|uniref:hypothetical protein n=1 Tax=Pedobacter immunditicola TaxID=3133440 RepID=UPI0030AA0BB6
MTKVLEYIKPKRALGCYKIIMDTYEKHSAINTIMVLTELDKSAKIAAEYALTLAQELKANILLYNSFLSQSSPFEPLPGDTNTTYIIKNSYEYLEKEVKRLQGILSSNQLSFNPDIFYLSEEGELADNIFNVLKKESVMMIVKGGCFDHDEDDLLGNEFQTILKRVRLPVLIVPEYGK